MKAEFNLTLFDDASVRKKLESMSTLETMLDDSRNPLPAEYYFFSDDVPLGRSVRVTFELLEEDE